MGGLRFSIEFGAPGPPQEAWMWLQFEVVRGPVGVVWGRFGAVWGPLDRCHRSPSTVGRCADGTATGSATRGWNIPAGDGRVRSRSGPPRKTWPGTFRAGPPEFNLELHWNVVKGADSTATYRI